MIINKNYVQFEKLNEYSNICHLFTLKPFNFRKGLVSDDKIKQQYDEISNIFNTSMKFIKPIQTHTNIVKCVTENSLNDTFEDVDGLITNIPGIALVTSLADCQGILLYDKNKQVIGNIHSGWKGTLNRIIENRYLNKNKSLRKSAISSILISILAFISFLVTLILSIVNKSNTLLIITITLLLFSILMLFIFNIIEFIIMNSRSTSNLFIIKNKMGIDEDYL